MRARFRSWWKKIKQHRVTILVAIILVVAIVLIIVGYRFDWTGFNGNDTSGKTLWDWLQLLFVPSVLTLGAVWFTARQNHELDIAIDNQQEAALQSYIDKMSELLLKEGLRESGGDSEQRTIALVRTLTVLYKLDPIRKRTVLKFLFESKLIDNNNPIVNLSYADLKEADLNGFTLHHCNLGLTNLSKANLEKADFIGTTLTRANMQSVNLSESNLENVDLSGANLKDVTGITVEELEKQAKSLKCATMPDGSIHP
jgi:hypothetical protein